MDGCYVPPVLADLLSHVIGPVYGQGGVIDEHR
jgi:ethanolamine transporter EutH